LTNPRKENLEIPLLRKDSNEKQPVEQIPGSKANKTIRELLEKKKEAKMNLNKPNEETKENHDLLQKSSPIHSPKSKVKNESNNIKNEIEEVEKISNKENTKSEIQEELGDLKNNLNDENKRVGGNENIEINDENLENNEQMIEELQHLQPVFVEDLGQELLMEEAGNLFDMDGNCIGQAEGDENEDNQQMDEEEEEGENPDLVIPNDNVESEINKVPSDRNKKTDEEFENYFDDDIGDLEDVL